MILVDTSVWIDFFKDKKTIQVDLLEKSLIDRKNICICVIILTEVLQGIRNEDQYRQVKSYFNNLIFLPMEYDTFIRAADIYRKLRKKGITIRKSVDCMIAAVCREHDTLLLHNDKDFDYIENHLDLKILINA